ncbi:MAG: M48 family metallopeptidase, partial [Bacteroidia bacterium]
MSKTSIIVAALLFSFSLLHAQNPNYYLKSDNITRFNSLPQLFKADYFEHLNAYKNEPRLIRLTQQSFINSSVMYDYQKVNSGQVLFNTELDLLFTQIATLIQSKNSLPNFEVFVLKTGMINAFASDNGNIFFTMGLLSRLNSEAEIAAVLCHEISHYILKHSTKGITKEIKSHLDIGTLRDTTTTFSEREGAHNYSQSFELQADSLGFEFMIKSGYNTQAFIGVLNILAKAQVPANDLPKKYNIPFVNLNMADHYANDSLQIIDIEITKKRESSSHPSLGAREKQINEYLNKSSISSINSNFITTNSANFKKLIKKVQYTTTEYYNFEKSAIEGYAHALAMYNEFENDAFIGFHTISYFFQIGQYYYDSAIYKFNEYGIYQKFHSKFNELDLAIINYSIATIADSIYNDTCFERLKYWSMNYLNKVKIFNEKDLFNLTQETRPTLMDKEQELPLKKVQNLITKLNIDKVKRDFINHKKHNTILDSFTYQSFNFKKGLLLITPNAYYLDVSSKSLLNVNKSIDFTQTLNSKTAELLSKTDTKYNSASSHNIEYYDQILKLNFITQNARYNDSIFYISNFTQIDPHNQQLLFNSPDLVI